MSNNEVVIIGAGLAGLATGIYAQMNGFQARIFEHARQPGGVSATWPRKGYLLDGGIHFYMGYRPGQPVHELYRELGIYQAEQYQQIDIYGRFVDPAKGASIDLTRDLDRLAGDLSHLSPGDGSFIDGFVKAAKAFENSDFLAAMAKPPELHHWMDIAKMTWAMRRQLRYYAGAFSQPMNQYTRNLKDPFLREFFNHIFLPDVPVWFVLFIMGMLAGGNMALRRDGSAGFAKALEKRFTSLGGRIHYNATVNRIIVENDQAVGVHTADEEEYRGDWVVSAADGYTTIFEMLGGHYIDAGIRERYTKWPLFTPVVMINYGVKREFQSDPWMVVIKSPRNITAGHLTDDWMPVRIFNYGSGFSSPGKTVVQVMIDSAWEPWHRLRNDMDAYKAEKRALADQVLECLCDIWPGLDRQIELADVSTPYTMWRYTLNREGAYEGFAISHKTINTKIYRTLPGLTNFYMAGQWTSPGGGVIPSLMTGRHATMLMCRDSNRKFESCI